jgi:hypothetical protein
MARRRTAGCGRLGSRSRPRSELGEPSAHRGGGARLVKRLGEDRQDLLVAAEVREVREREVHGPSDVPGPAQLLQFEALAVSTWHVLTMEERADPGLACR